MTTRTDDADLAAVPLILDVDGTLLRTDLLYENLWVALRRDFLATLILVLRCFWHPARLKRRLSEIAAPDLNLLPVREPVLDLARQAVRSGRRVILTSGADQELTRALARHLDLPGEHFGSDGQRNLTGAAKAAFLVERFGAGGFDYAGNAWPDLQVWRSARRIIAVDPGRRLAARLASLGVPVQTIGKGWRLASLLKAMRPSHWMKNLLLLLPVLAAHDLTAQTVLPVLAAIAGFCAASSAGYLLNDLFDLEADRKHPEKRHRPVAASQLPIRAAMWASIGLTLAALTTAAAVGWEIAALTAVYLISSVTYSARIKRIRWLDLVVLASLYTLRVMTGAAASGIGVSGWLIGFCFAMFFALGTVKRLTGLARSPDDGPIPGRDYARRDIGSVLRVGLLAGLAAVVIFLGYTFSPQAGALYSNLVVLRLAVIPAAGWLVRMIWLSRNGQEDYDPIDFVSHDKVGLAIVAVGLALVFYSI